MGPRKIEQRGKADQAKHELEICEIGEDKIKEAEGTLTWGGIEAIDDECSWAVSSRFALPNEDISRAIAAFEQIDDDSNDLVDEARKQSREVCGLGGMSEREIMEPSGGNGESLLSTIDEVDDPQTSFLESEGDSAQSDNSIAELSIAELAKLFDF